MLSDTNCSAVCDAAIDLDMLLSHPYVSLSCKPTAVDRLAGTIEDGDTATAAQTCGDGTVSLHSLWGSVKPTLDDGGIFFCPNARLRSCQQMPIDCFTVFASPCGVAARQLLQNIAADPKAAPKDGAAPAKDGAPAPPTPAAGAPGPGRRPHPGSEPGPGLASILPRFSISA